VFHTFKFQGDEWVNYEERQLNIQGTAENEYYSLLKEEKRDEQLRIQQLYQISMKEHASNNYESPCI
jgi:hypothetical protein